MLEDPQQLDPPLPRAVEDPGGLALGEPDQLGAATIGVLVGPDQEVVVVAGHARWHPKVHRPDAELIGDPLQREQVLVGHLGRGQDPDLLRPVAPERAREVRDRFVPAELDVGAARAPYRREEATVVVDPAEAVAALVADPPPVHVGVVARLDARDPAALVVVGPPPAVVHLDVAAPRAPVADRAGGVEVPHPDLEAELPVGERAHRADVDDVARVVVLERLAREEPDLRVVAPVEDAELAGAGHLVAEPHAARAEDAALRVQDDVGPERHRLRLVDLLVRHPRVVEPVLHVVDLQPALARLVAHRAVERVIDRGGTP